MALQKPYSEQAERAVLGAMLVDVASVSYCVSVLTVEDFFIDGYKLIYQAMYSLFQDRITIDITSVTTRLKDLGNLEAVGGVPTLIDLTEGVVAPNVSYYIDILRDKTNLRRLADFLEKAYSEYNDKSTQNIHLYLNEFEEDVLAITRARSVSDFESLEKLVGKYQATLTDKSRTKTGITTGYQYLDNLLDGGFHPGNLIILAARPGVGKTALALNFCVNAAANQKVPVAFFSLEMSSEELMHRLIAMTGRINQKKVKNGQFNNSDDMIRLDQACKKLKTLPIHIDDTPGLTLIDLVAKVRKIKGEISSLGLVVVDYLQIVESETKKNESRERAVAKIATTLKTLARELNIAILALAQLSRSTDKNRGNPKGGVSEKRPELSDLRESGQIEQDADVVAFIHREAFYQNANEGEQPQTEDIEVIVKKNRNGSMGRVFLVFTPNCLKYDGKLMNKEDMED